MPDGEQLRIEVPQGGDARRVLGGILEVAYWYLELFDTALADTYCCIVHPELVPGERLFCAEIGLLVVILRVDNIVIVQHRVKHQRHLKKRITPPTSQRRVSGQRALACRLNYADLHLEVGDMVHQDYLNEGHRVYIVSESRDPKHYFVATLTALRADPSASVGAYPLDLIMHAYPHAGTFEPSTHLRHVLWEKDK